MNADASGEVAKMTAAFGLLLNAADRDTRLELLRRLGRSLLLQRPMIDGLATPTDEELERWWSQNPWVDIQLYDAFPEQAGLDGLDDWKLETLETAWPEGFDEVVFNSGEDDADQARALVKAYLHTANEHSMPIMTDFDATDAEMEQQLQEEFVALIRKWRARVIELLT